MHPPLKYIITEQFIDAERFQNWQRTLTAIGFVISFLVSMLSVLQLEIVKFPAVAILLTFLSLVLLLVSQKFKEKYRNALSKAERLRKQDFLRDVMKTEVDLEEDGYLIHSLSESTIMRANKRYEAEKGKGPNQQEYFTLMETLEGRIAESIQQNCNQTSIHLFKYYSELQKSYIPILQVLSALVGLVIIYFFVIQLNQSLTIGRMAISAISFYFSFDLITQFEAYKKESEELKKLDKAIGQIKWDPSNQDLMFYFSEYNSILERKPLYPYRVYAKHKDRITTEWEERLKRERNHRTKSFKEKK